VRQRERLPTDESPIPRSAPKRLNGALHKAEGAGWATRALLAVSDRKGELCRIPLRPRLTRPPSDFGDEPII